ncbi:ATP-binding protein [Piscinibacter terrae]|nr:ATP-binding protein [Albitalea terrae]
MNIFVAGIHGVGKTYLAKRLPPASGLMHKSASVLIKEERALPEWNTDKRVADVDGNQVALAKAVARYNAEGTALLLDGHFVLVGQNGLFVPLGADVFKALNLSAIVLIEAPPDVVAGRVTQRDELHRDSAWLTDFMAKERTQAELVCAELNLPLTVLNSPSDADFAFAIASLARDRG